MGGDDGVNERYYLQVAVLNPKLSHPPFMKQGIDCSIARAVYWYTVHKYDATLLLWTLITKDLLARSFENTIPER